MVHDQLHRAQKEQFVAMKPAMKVLSFYFSVEFLTLQEFVPELAAVFQSVSVCVVLQLPSTFFFNNVL